MCSRIATASLSDYARKARKGTLIVTRRGKPVAALMPVDARTDLENLVVTTHPTFRAIMECSEARYQREGGLSTKQVRALVGKTTQQKRANVTHWSSRSMAKAAGISTASVLRIWRKHGLECGDGRAAARGA